MGLIRIRSSRKREVVEISCAKAAIELSATESKSAVQRKRADGSANLFRIPAVRFQTSNATGQVDIFCGMRGLKAFSLILRRKANPLRREGTIETALQFLSAGSKVSISSQKSGAERLREDDWDEKPRR